MALKKISELAAISALDDDDILVVVEDGTTKKVTVAELRTALQPAYYDPDRAPASPSADDDEFNDGSVAGAWTQDGSPDTVSESTYDGFLYLADNDNTQCAVYKTFAPGAAAFTYVTKMHLGGVLAAFAYGGIIITDSSGTALATQTVQFEPVTAARVRTGATGLTTVTNDIGQTGPYYLAIRRDSGTNYTTWISKDGIAWVRTASFSQAGTVARAYLAIFAITGSELTAMFDFVRFFNTETLVIGS